MKKRIWTILLALCMALTLVPAVFAADAPDDVIASGECGNHASYTLTEDGVLTISGEGPTDSFYDISTGTAKNTAPWSEYMEQICKVVIEEGITELGQWAFDGATALTSVSLPESLEAIGPSAFSYSAITQIKLPENMKEIQGFSACTKLKSITFGENVTAIGDYCFSGCSALKEIQIPATVQELGHGCFQYTGLISVEVPQGIQTLPGECFAHCKKLTQVVLPDSIKLMVNNCFDDCTSLQEVSLPDGLEEIQRCAFQNCTALKSVTIPEGIDVIDGLFSGCSALEEVNLPSTVKRIESGAFNYCTALESIVLPDGLKELGYGAFFGCSALQYIVIPDGTLEIGERCFAYCKNLELAVIPDTVSTIGDSAFMNCSALQGIRIPIKLKRIEFQQFSNCKKLETVFLPTSVETIGADAFEGCSKLAEVYYPGTEKQLQNIRIGDGNNRLLKAQFYLIDGYPDAYYGLFDLPAEDNWAYPGIAFCLDNGIMNGMGNGLFQPGGSTTRAQLVTILYRLMGEPAVSAKTPFKDLKQDWYKNAVAWAYENGVVNGMSKTEFQPDTPITREMMMTILYRLTGEYLKLDVSASGKLSGFPDAKKVSSWAKDGMVWGVGAGLISGVGTRNGTELQPKGTATRAQIAKVIMGYCLDILDPALEPTEGAPAA